MRNKTVQKAVRSLDSIEEFCQNIKNALDRKAINRVDSTERLMRKSALHEAFPPQAGAAPVQTGGAVPPAGVAAPGINPNVSSKDAELVLDPDYEKEYYMDSDEFGDHYVIYKKLGLGMAKPIRVYIDNKPWEIFTTIKMAKKITKEYISSGRIDKDKKQSEEEAEDKTKQSHDSMMKHAEVQHKIAQKFGTDQPGNKANPAKPAINKEDKKTTADKKDKKESEKK